MHALARQRGTSVAFARQGPGADNGQTEIQKRQTQVSNSQDQSDSPMTTALSGSVNPVK